MKLKSTPCALAIVLALLPSPPARAQGPVEVGTGDGPAAPAPVCADRPRLQAEHDSVRRTITDYAMGGADRRQKRRSANAGRTAAQAVVGLFIPFGIGLAVGGTVALAEAADKKAKAKRPQPPPPPEPDIGA
ncbi:MAG: hypothetical protein JWO25_380, partial [Alphaproteobacteria bacterium]|nr:hypothetical protein [Alphaproteobacteria bacterium]